MLEANKAVARRLYEEVFEAGRLDTADELVDADGRDLADLQDRRGPRRVKQLATSLGIAFPDRHWEIQALTAEDDRVVMHSTFSGTHKGDFMGMPATGRSFTGIHHVYLFRMRDGKVIEYQAVRDDMTFMRQLGLIAPPD